MKPTINKSIIMQLANHYCRNYNIGLSASLKLAWMISKNPLFQMGLNNCNFTIHVNVINGNFNNIGNGNNANTEITNYGNNNNLI